MEIHQVRKASSPKVSVVMPTYNAAAYLYESIGSILSQTFRDFEFIIVNDGSSDDTNSILDRYQKSDKRIRVYHQENQGMIAALNRGCRLARGQYIARMDADDVSFASRLEKQVEYIEKHPHIEILGTWICRLKNESPAGTWCPPTNPTTLKWNLFFGVPVAGPSVLMRREVIEKINFYRPDAVHAEDVDLWLRASAVTEFGNVPEVLYKYRVWNGSTSQTDQQIRRNAHVELLVPFIKNFLKIDPLSGAVVGLRRTRVGPPFEDLTQIHQTARLIQKLYQRFVKENVLTLQERREISWDAARRVASLALQASRFRTADSMLLFLQALKLDYRLLYPSAIVRGLERALEHRMSRAMVKKPTFVGSRRANLSSYAREPGDEK
jgi:glycosyltransferase involved in cell wall biosynthesis